MNSKLFERLCPVLWGVVFFLGLIGAAAAQAPLPEASPAAPGSAEQSLEADEGPGVPLEQIRTFAEIFTRIKRDYVRDVDDVSLLESAIKGMLAGLDPHSVFLDRDAFRSLQERAQGRFGGLGIEVSMENGLIKVIAPIDDTPAQRAGIESGDLITHINDQSVRGMSLGEAVDKMRGHPGTAVTLSVVRKGLGEVLRVHIVRAIIRVRSVKARLLEPGIALFRLSNFQSDTSEELWRALQRLRTDSDGELRGAVLDLRNNPGGILDAAVRVSDMFLEEGLIVVSTKGRTDSANLEYPARSPDALQGAPLVVLVNGGSASASEIVAGALQDQRRALIVGEPTFGKGSVQTLLTLRDEGALKLTTALYYTPSGRSIQAKGITPDVVLERIRPNLDNASEGTKEAALKGHLQNKESEEGESSGQTAPSAPGQQDSSEKLVLEDYPLYEALNLLRGLIAMSSTAPRMEESESEQEESL